MQRVFFGLGLLILAAGANAAPSLREAVESAWAKHPTARTETARREQYGASRDAAAAWLAEPPRVSVMQRTDRWNDNAGAREREVELELPLSLPAIRDARIAVAERESAQYGTATAAGKWRLAGEVREAWWAARLTANDLSLAQRKADEARQLAADVERRFKAGDVARTDWNQAQGAARLAEVGAADAQAKAFRATRAFQSLTGLGTPPDAVEIPAAKPTALDTHVQLAELGRNVDTARARLDEAGANRRDPPVVSMGTVRERNGFGDPSAGSVMLRLTIPFATQARNQPKLAAANADLIEAQAKLQLEAARIAAEIASGEEDLVQARRQVEFAQARAVLARDTHALFDKAYKLGEIDLATRLRAEADRFDAELALSRAELEHGRAISRLNQVLGLLP